VARSTNPRAIVLLNLSRDQLDRAAEVRLLAERWQSVVRDTAATVVANASDPLIVFAAREASTVVWCDVEHSWNIDAVACPVCTGEIAFTAETWSCSCGFAKPAASVRQRGATVTVDGVDVELSLGLPGSFNNVNAAMALAAVAHCGVTVAAAARAMSSVTAVAGRYSERRLHGQKVRLALAKNPAGFASLLSMVGEGTDPVWLSVNARVADGLDPSWLYDAPFEKLTGRHVYCFGDRRLDMATRLDLAGVSFTVVNDTTPPVSGQSVWAIGNYTAFADWLKESSPW
jgi:UDP-N-acetylmuramyl tripeptide synthase